MLYYALYQLLKLATFFQSMHLYENIDSSIPHCWNLTEYTTDP